MNSLSKSVIVIVLFLLGVTGAHAQVFSTKTECEEVLKNNAPVKGYVPTHNLQRGSQALPTGFEKIVLPKDYCFRGHVVGGTEPTNVIDFMTGRSMTVKTAWIKLSKGTEVVRSTSSKEVVAIYACRNWLGEGFTTVCNDCGRPVERVVEREVIRENPVQRIVREEPQVIRENPEAQYAPAPAREYVQQRPAYRPLPDFVPWGAMPGMTSGGYNGGGNTSGHTIITHPGGTPSVPGVQPPRTPGHTIITHPSGTGSTGHTIATQPSSGGASTFYGPSTSSGVGAPRSAGTAGGHSLSTR